MKFSLIVPTKGRVAELERLFQSLTAQTLTDFEVIISDQNDDNRLVDVVTKFSPSLRLVHLRSERGASRARNAGIARAQGEFLTFPDDDCTCPPDLLERVAAFFDTHPQYAFLTGRSYADDGEDSIARHGAAPSVIVREKIHQQCIEHALFIRRGALGELRFDEAMGVGAPTPWQSDEGPDLVLRLEDEGQPGYYDPGFGVWHPRTSASLSDPRIFQRSYGYACGTGYFLRKHHYSVWSYRYRLLRVLIGALLALLKFNVPKARVYFLRWKGLSYGWHGYRP